MERQFERRLKSVCNEKSDSKTKKRKKNTKGISVGNKKKKKKERKAHFQLSDVSPSAPEDNK